MTESERPTDWFWEGNVQRSIVAYLKSVGWGVLHEADTGRREPGPDIEARQLARSMYIEVKGYPSDRYRDPRRAGEKKPTSPSLQARHWFAEAFLQVVILGDQDDAYETAIGLPDCDLYQRLVAGCELSLTMLGIGVYFVREDGSVVLALDHRSRHEAMRGS